MDKRTPRPMTLFDELTMPPQFRMMKLMLPYTPATTRPMLAILIKFMELQHTIRLFSENPNALSPSQDSLAQGNTANAQGFSLHMIEEILPYLAPQERDMFENMKNMMGMMEMMQMMQEMQEMPETDDRQETAEEQGPRKPQGEHGGYTDGTPPPGRPGFSDGAAQASTGTPFSGLNPMDLLQNMLSPQQQEMFRTYQNIFESEGGDSHERMDE